MNLTVSGLENLALAAELHAAEAAQAEAHASRKPARRLSLERVDRILARERQQPQSTWEALLLSYGAWVGQWMVKELSARWFGLAEPASPRVQLGSMTYAPFDMVWRRLRSPTAASVEQCVREAQRVWQEELAGSGHSAPPWPQHLKQHNQAAWDQLAASNYFVNHTYPATREQAEAAIDPWLLEYGVAGKQVLCLAAGGGTHAPLLARAGGLVTVVDISQRMLEIDQKFAQTTQLPIAVQQGSIDDLSGLASASFDLAVQPVSMSYLADPERVYHEVARVLKPDGLYVLQHKSPVGLQAEFRADEAEYRLACHVGSRAPAVKAEQPTDGVPMELSAMADELGTWQVAHSLEVLLGGLCRAGFVIEDFQEPPRADGWAKPGQAAHRALFAPPYMKVKARRRGASATTQA